MFAAFLYKDARGLRHRTRSFVLLALAIVVALGVLGFDSDGSGAALFGIDFVRLFVLSAPGLATFLEFYMESLADDKRDGILALIMFNGMSRLAYFLVKVLIPLGLALIASIVTVSVYLLFMAGTGFSVGALGSFMGIIGGELFLAMGLGMLLDIVTDVSITVNPSIAFPLILVNIPLLYFANPMHHYWFFIGIVAALGVLCYIASLVCISRLYRSNLTPKAK